jgi:hypothetical protein
MTDEPPVLTNQAAATRLRALLRQLTTEEPPLRTRLVKRLTPTAEERWQQTLPCPRHRPEQPGAAACS